MRINDWLIIFSSCQEITERLVSFKHTGIIE